MIPFISAKISKQQLDTEHRIGRQEKKEVFYEQIKQNKTATATKKGK